MIRENSFAKYVSVVGGTLLVLILLGTSAIWGRPAVAKTNEPIAGAEKPAMATFEKIVRQFASLEFTQPAAAGPVTVEKRTPNANEVACQIGGHPIAKKDVKWLTLHTSQPKGAKKLVCRIPYCAAHKPARVNQMHASLLLVTWQLTEKKKIFSLSEAEGKKRVAAINALKLDSSKYPDN